MSEWNPGDLCQVRRGKRWVDAEVDSVEHYGRPGNVRVVLEGGHRVRADAANIRPRPAPRGKLPEPTIALSEAQVREALEEGRQVRRELEEKFRRMRQPEPTTKLGASEVVADPRLKADEAFVLSRPREKTEEMPQDAPENASTAGARARVLRPVPKPTTARSLAYLAHVRRHPCCSCGATEAIHAHHVASGGMGQKASDYLTAPLCGVCHQHWHATAALPYVDAVSAMDETAMSRGILWEAAARCLEEWITREGE